jgi:hypothetical protein
MQEPRIKSQEKRTRKKREKKKEERRAISEHIYP